MRTELTQSWAEIKEQFNQMDQWVTKCAKPKGNLEASMRLRKTSLALRKELQAFRKLALSYDTVLRDERAATRKGTEVTETSEG